MKRDVMIILMSSRKDTATKVQQILTAWGCYIKTRLGLHQGTLDECSESGLLFLELVGDKEKHEELSRKLNLIESVSAELLQLKIDE